MSRRLPGALALGAAASCTLVAVALLGLLWTPYDPTAIAIADKLRAPSAAHWLGTDQLGRDVLSMIVAGAHNSLGVALLAVLIGVAGGVPLGLLAASRGGLAAETILRVNDLVFAFPSLLLAILITAIWGPGAVTAILAIGIFNIPVFARLTRAGALPLWTRDFIAAARIAGKGRLAISVEHIVPNLAGLLIVQAAIQFAIGVLAEAGLSYVGLGAQPPAVSWGRMLNEAQTLTALSPTLAIFPGLSIVVTVLAFNLLGEGLRRRVELRAVDSEQPD